MTLKKSVRVSISCASKCSTRCRVAEILAKVDNGAGKNHDSTTCHKNGFLEGGFDAGDEKEMPSLFHRLSMSFDLSLSVIIPVINIEAIFSHSSCGAML